MRRVATVLAALAAAGSFTLAMAGAAWAAQGLLTINDEPHENPSGCYRVSPGPVDIVNNTDQSATVYRATNCTGRVLETVQPSGESDHPLARSVHID